MFMMGVCDSVKMWKLTCFVFLSVILFYAHFINTAVIDGVPELMPNEIIFSVEENTTNSTTEIQENPILLNQSIEENTDFNTTNSTTENQENPILVSKQTISTLEVSEETLQPIDYNTKHEISNTSFISSIESHVTESSNRHFAPVTQIVPVVMDETSIFPVQKCCPKGEVMVLRPPGEPSVCQKSTQKFDMDVFCANLTHYWNCTTTDSSNVEILSRDPCKESKFYLDPTDETDMFRLLSNTSLYIPFSMDMLNTDQYCVDTIQGSENFTTAFICTAPPSKINFVFNVLYLIGLCLSIVLLFALACYSSRRNDIKEDHKKYLTLFASTMATAVLFEFFQTICFNYFTDTINIMILYLIYLVKLNCYLWLNMLTYDIYRCVRESSSEKYMKSYLIATIIIPLILMCFSFIDGFVPPLPYRYSWLKQSSSHVSVICLYIVPVALSISANIFFFLRISLPKKTRYTNVKDLVADFQSKDWKDPRDISEIKRMYFRSWALFLIISTCFLLDVVFYFVQAHFVFRDFFYCLQGALITLSFIKKCWPKKSIRNDAHNDTELNHLATAE